MQSRGEFREEGGRFVPRQRSQQAYGLVGRLPGPLPVPGVRQAAAVPAQRQDQLRRPGRVPAVPLAVDLGEPPGHVDRHRGEGVGGPRQAVGQRGDLLRRRPGVGGEPFQRGHQRVGALYLGGDVHGERSEDPRVALAQVGERVVEVAAVGTVGGGAGVQGEEPGGLCRGEGPGRPRFGRAVEQRVGEVRTGAQVVAEEVLRQPVRPQRAPDLAVRGRG